MKRKPKKYDYDNKTNDYGNLTFCPKNWISFDAAEINKKKKTHKIALESKRLYTYQVLAGFTKSGRFFNPVLYEIIHKDQLPLFQRLVKQAEKDISQEKEKAKKAKQTKAYKIKAKEKREQRLKHKQKLVNLCIKVGIEPNKYGLLLADNLDDITQAHIDWLFDAYSALKYSIENKGIMYKFLKNYRDCEGLTFYDALCIAIKAYRRHEYTDYDDLLRQGISKETARELIEQ